MTDRLDFEHRLVERLSAHTAGVVRPFDAAAISASAAQKAGSGSRWTLPKMGIRRTRRVVPTVVWLAIVALLIAVVGASLLTGGRPRLPAVVQPSPSPAVSPSSASLAVLPGEPWFAFAMPGGHAPGGGVFLAREDGSDAHEILQPTDAAAGVHRDRPDWSPDGSQLAFETWSPDTAHADAERIEIWVADADGSNPEQVTDCQAPCQQHSYPAWSRDGRQIMYIRFDSAGDTIWGPSAIEILDVASGRVRVVSQTNDGATAYYSPRWSSDGTQIVFTIETYSDATEATTLTSSLAIVRADGSDGDSPRVIPLPDLQVRNPDWNPIDDRIVFQAAPTSGSVTIDLHVIQADGTGYRNLTDFGTTGINASEPTWTPDGERITFSRIVAGGGDAVRHAASIAGTGSAPVSILTVAAAAPRLRPTP